MIISKIALCIACGAAAVLVPVQQNQKPAAPPTVQAVQPQYHPPSGDVHLLANAFPP